MDAPAEKTAKPRRRWFRFSLRTLLILVTVLSLPLGWVGWRLGEVRRERATITWVEEMGGKVDFPSRINPDERSWWEKSTDKWFGERVWLVTLYETQVTDLSPLAELKSLKEIAIGHTQVSDLLPLADLKDLERLYLNNTQVSDLSPLGELKNLEVLSLQHTQVTDLSPLAELKSLESLWLHNTQVSDLSILVELKNLEYLGVRNTWVSDLSPLAELKNLKMLTLNDTPVSDEQVEELRQALPNARLLPSKPTLALAALCLAISRRRGR
jgi:hypothetical protein